MYRMLQQAEPRDLVVATGETHGIREFLEIAFSRLGLDWKDYVISDPRFLRPIDVDSLVGDAGRARDELGWAPKTTFEGLVTMMVDADLILQQRAVNQAAR